MSSGKRKLEPPATEDETARLEDLRRKRQAKLQAMRATEGASGPSAASVPAIAPPEAAAASSSASEPTAPALPDEADGDEAAYFDREEEAIDAPDGAPATNGHDAPNGVRSSSDAVAAVGPEMAPPAPVQPSSVDSTVEPDERADALEAYMAQIAATQGALSAAAAQQQGSNSRCVLLENLLTPALAADQEECHQTRMETGHECSKWGTLLRVHCVGAFDEHAAPVADHIAGRVFVEFESADAADECARAMDGRYFDGLRVSATFYPVEPFLNGDFSLSGAEVRQTAITWEDISAMNSRPASSWDTMVTASAAGAQADGGGAAGAAGDSAAARGGGGGSAGGGASAAAAGVAGKSSEAMDVDAGGGEAVEEPSNFHAEFMKQMRAQAAEAARQQQHASQEVLEGRDDAMDALVEEFPDAVEGGGGKADEDSDEDDEASLEKVLAARAKKKELPRVDHASIEYPPFRKAFYIEVPEIKALSDEDVDAMRKELDQLKVRGKRVPRPIRRWAQAGLSDRLLGAIERTGYTKPFPIQAQTLPAVMSGRDVIAIAKTGSGKTMGYTLPMLRHVIDQPPLLNGDGPIGIVMVPTRELAMQVYREVTKFAKVVSLNVVAVYGGANLKQQIAELKRGAEMVVCTPGRMIDMLTANSGRVTNLRRVTYVVLDEADRMFDMGFAPQVCTSPSPHISPCPSRLPSLIPDHVHISVAHLLDGARISTVLSILAPQIDRIVGNIRPDRQTMLFSATFPQAVEKLARGVLTKPVQIIAGGVSVVSNTIEQHVEVLPTEGKLPRLCAILRQYFDDGQQLVFVDTQEACDSLFRGLLKNNMPCATLHGGMAQDDRDNTISDFKSGNVMLLVATSVAARGLDVKGLALVVNYEVPNHYEDYVHRVGRTGRAGNSGTAYTFLCPDEDKYAPDLVRAMEAAGQEPPDEVVGMANAYIDKRKRGELLSKDYRTSGFKTGKGFGFDADSLLKEEKSKREKRRRDKHAAGVDGGGDEEESDDDAAAVKVVGGNAASSSAGGSSAVQKPMDAATSMAEAAASAAKALQLKLGNVAGASGAAAEVQRRLLEASRNAAAAPSSAISAGGAAAPAAANHHASNIAMANAAGATGMGAVTLNPAALAAAAAMASSVLGGARAAGGAGSAIPVAASVGGGPPNVLAAAAAGAAALAARQAGVTPPSFQAQAQSVNDARIAALPLATQRALAQAQQRANEALQRAQGEAQEKARAASEAIQQQQQRATRYTAELEINEYPQAARFKVMQRETLAGISEFTKAAIVTKGSYYPPGRNPPPGERKLYFFIEAGSEAAVKDARKELRRSLLEHAATAAPQEDSKYGKYRV